MNRGKKEKRNGRDKAGKLEERQETRKKEREKNGSEENKKSGGFYLIARKNDVERIPSTRLCAPVALQLPIY